VEIEERSGRGRKKDRGGRNLDGVPSFPLFPFFPLRKERTKSPLSPFSPKSNVEKGSLLPSFSSSLFIRIVGSELLFLSLSPFFLSFPQKPPLFSLFLLFLPREWGKRREAPAGTLHLPSALLKMRRGPLLSPFFSSHVER